MLDALLYEQHKNEIHPSSKWGQMISASGVQRSHEFDRISKLPRRDWEKWPELTDFTARLDEWLRCESSARTHKLLPQQAIALKELAETKGGFVGIPPGEGKAFISLLGPSVLPVKRPLLLVPADVYDQTVNDVLPIVKANWRVHPGLTIRKYSELSLAKNEHMLDELAPDFIAADEGHALKNYRQGRGKRVKRYMDENPLTIFMPLTATPNNRSLMEWALLCRWALKPDMAPVPGDWRELRMWADALDHILKDESQRKPPGVIATWCVGEETPAAAYGRRVRETPGMVMMAGAEVGASVWYGTRAPAVPKEIDRALQHVRDTWTTPTGEELLEAATVAGVKKALSLGFFYRLDPAPPAEWRNARSAWAKYVRKRISASRSKVDTELQVLNEARAAVRAGEKIPEVVAWDAVRDLYDPDDHKQVIWLSDFAVDDASAWLAESEEPGLVWTDLVAFGERLQLKHGVRYFGAGSSDDLRVAKAQNCVLSLDSHHKGKNLQDRWARNLLATPSGSGAEWEQFTGRTHRRGQVAERVTVEAYAHVEELRSAIRMAHASAQALQAQWGQKYRLVYGDKSKEFLEVLHGAASSGKQ